MYPFITLILLTMIEIKTYKQWFIKNVLATSPFCIIVGCLRNVFPLNIDKFVMISHTCFPPQVRTCPPLHSCMHPMNTALLYPAIGNYNIIQSCAKTTMNNFNTRPCCVIVVQRRHTTTIFIKIANYYLFK